MADEWELVVQTQALVGEGPVWNVDEQALYWVDIKDPAIHRLNWADRHHRHWPMPERIGCIAFRERGGLVAAFKSGFKTVDLDSGRIDPLVDPEPHLPGNRFNDGKVDPAGRLWAGTMDDAEIETTGTLYRLNPDGSCVAMKSEMALSNGLGWSPDGATMYYTCSLTRKIMAFDYRVEDGTIANERIFARVDSETGFSDGLAVDADGFIWAAHWGGWRLTRYAPDGAIERVVQVPVPQPSSCCFGGPDMDILFVTSASIDLTAAELAKAPWSGGVLAMRPGVHGLPDTKFAG